LDFPTGGEGSFNVSTEMLIIEHMPNADNRDTDHLAGYNDIYVVLRGTHEPQRKNKTPKIADLFAFIR
jgi:hypothetical protein